MHLVFAHGWGFDASFWDRLAPLLAEYKQTRIERGFLGAPCHEVGVQSSAILIGHSLGFVHGMRQRRDWAGWIAINGFARFVLTPDGTGCISSAVLREMRLRLLKDPQKTLTDFYKLVGAGNIPASLDKNRLCEGLDELRDGDVKEGLMTLKVPGLVLAAKNDPLIPAQASGHLGKINAKAQLQWHENGGHLLPLIDHHWCAQKINDFMRLF